MPNVTIIGAGSVEFTIDVLSNILSFEDLTDVSVVLHDIDETRLETAGRIGARINEAKGGRATIETQLDRRKALDGADYAINEIQVGGRDAFLIDFAIPGRYGVRQTIADTLGIGGISRGLRTLPVMIDIGNDMADVCPDATLLNFTNPMAMVPWAVYDGSRFDRVVGLCHSVFYTHEFMAETVGVPMDEIAFQTSGFNHQAFVTRFERERRGPVPGARRRDRGRPRGTGPSRAGPALQGAGVLPDRVERALRGVRVMVHAARRPDRAVPHPGRRLHRSHRGGAGGLPRDRAQARSGRARGRRAGERARLRHHPLDRDRHAARALREREEHRV